MKNRSIFLSMRLAIIAVALFTGQFALAAVASLAPMPANMLLGLNSSDVSAITQYATANMKPLISTLVNGLDIAKDITVMQNVKNKADMPKLAISKGFKPYTGTFASEDSTAVYTNRQLSLSVGQRDMLIDPEDYRNSFLAQFAAPGASPDNIQAQVPFKQFLFDQVIKKLSAEINDMTAYFGFDKTTATAWGAGSTYAVGDIVTYTQNSVSKYFECLAITTAAQSPDTHPAKWNDVSAGAVAPGIKSFVSSITGTNAVTTGAISSSATGLAAALVLYRAIPAAYRNENMVMHVSFTDFDYIVSGLLETYGKYTMDDINTMGGVFLPMAAKKCLIKPASWLGTSRRMLLEQANPADNWRGLNLHMGTDLTSDINQIKVLERAYKLELAIKFGIGFQVADLSAIWKNDQA